MPLSEKQLKSTFETKLFHYIVWMIVLAAIAILVFKRHEHTGHFNWRSKMWGDQAGYYVYLPAFFIYDFDGNELPENIVKKTGEGFEIDEEGNIITRYTTGVAILQAPVFLAVHAVAALSGQAQDGFSGSYHLVSAIAAILYSFFGLLLLYHFLLFYFRKNIVILTLATIFFGTNLLYYTIDATGMSHIYSFFLFSVLLLVSKLFFSKSSGPQRKNLYFTAIAFTSALIILVRPTNLVFVGLVFLLDIHSPEELKERFIKVFTLKRLLILAVAFFLIFLPQMLYWKHSAGSYITDSYEGYGFTNWASPQIFKFLFSTNNGLFLYNPLYFLIIFAMLYMVWKKQVNGYYILAVFAGLIYLFSSWFIFSFGCGFGSRNFVEYTTVFTLPLGYMYQNFLKRSMLKWLGLLPLVFVLVYINIRLTSSFNKCFIGGDWDWQEYTYLLKIQKYTRSFNYNPELIVERHMEYTDAKAIKIDEISDLPYRRALVEAKLRLFSKDPEALLVLQLQSSDSILYWNGIKISEQVTDKDLGKAKKITGDYWLPQTYTTDAVLSAFIWNLGNDSLHISKIRINLE